MEKYFNTASMLFGLVGGVITGILGVWRYKNDYLEAFVHIVSDIWGIPVLDSRSSGIYMNSNDFLAKYTEDGNSISHLNAAGHDLYSEKVSKFIQGL